MAELSESLWVNDWNDRRQAKRINELNASLHAAQSSAARERRRMQSRLADLQGTLESRIDRLAKAFDAFVELSDLRTELFAFSGAAEVRHHAATVLGGLTSESELPPKPDDVSDYWLGPATEALRAMVLGIEASEAVGRAVERDAERSRLFWSLALPIFGRGSLVREEWLAPILEEYAAGVSVTELGRQIWISSARGVYGSGMRQRLLETLRAVVPEPSLPEWRDALISSPPRRDPDPLEKVAEISEQRGAADRLSQLAAWCDTWVGVPEEDSAVDSGDLLDDVGPDGASDDASGDAEDSGSGPDFSVALLTFLIEEGSPRERELLARARELRALLNDERPSVAVDPDAPTKPPEQWLLADAVQCDDRALARVAITVGVPTIRAIAEQLAESASVRPPSQVTLQGRARKVTVSGRGVSAETRDEIDKHVGIGRRADKGKQNAAYVCFGVAVIAVLLMLVGWGFVFVALIAAVVGWVLLKQQRGLDATNAASLERRRKELTDDAERLAATYVDYVSDTDARAGKAADELAEINAALSRIETASSVSS